MRCNGLTTRIFLGEESMIVDYFAALADMCSYCTRFKEGVIASFFTRKVQYGSEKSDTPVESWAYLGSVVEKMAVNIDSIFVQMFLILPSSWQSPRLNCKSRHGTSSSDNLDFLIRLPCSP